VSTDKVLELLTTPGDTASKGGSTITRGDVIIENLCPLMVFSDVRGAAGECVIAAFLAGAVIGRL
jgi:hypothetical protein